MSTPPINSEFHTSYRYEIEVDYGHAWVKFDYPSYDTEAAAMEMLRTGRACWPKYKFRVSKVVTRVYQDWYAVPETVITEGGAK
jgi:hypothetical protein